MQAKHVKLIYFIASEIKIVHGTFTHICVIIISERIFNYYLNIKLKLKY